MNIIYIIVDHNTLFTVSTHNMPSIKVLLHFQGQLELIPAFKVRVDQEENNPPKEKKGYRHENAFRTCHSRYRLHDALADP